MKLCALHEDNSRRDFLKKTGVAAATATLSPIAALKSVIGSAATSKYVDAVKIFRSLSPGMQKNVGSVLAWLTYDVDSNITDINNFDLRRPLDSSHVAWEREQENTPVGTFVKDGMMYRTDYEGNDKELFPLRAVIGYNLSQHDRNDSPSDIVDTWLSGANPEILEKIQPSVVNDMLSVAIDKSGGVKGFMKLLKGFHIGDHGGGNDMSGWGGDAIGSPLGAWKLAIRHPLLQKATGMSPADVQSAIKNGGKAMRQMVRNGMVDHDTVVKHFQTQKRTRKIRKLEKEYHKKNLERDRQERQEQERKKEPERPEEYEISQDYRAASPMHQWFEHRLNRILSGMMLLL